MNEAAAADPDDTPYAGLPGDSSPGEAATTVWRKYVWERVSQTEGLRELVPKPHSSVYSQGQVSTVHAIPQLMSHREYWKDGAAPTASRALASSSLRSVSLLRLSFFTLFFMDLSSTRQGGSVARPQKGVRWPCETGT